MSPEARAILAHAVHALEHDNDGATVLRVRMTQVREKLQALLDAPPAPAPVNVQSIADRLAASMRGVRP